ncbi:MAG: SAM-dependent methyltransferase, partial [Thermodesulfobacteriota bacterium]
MFFFSVSLLSAGALAYQVLLMRLLSVVLWHHFAATVISLALLGYGVSGAVLSLAQGPLVARFPWAYRVCCALFGALAPATFALAQRIPFEPMAAVWEPRQWAYFGAMYLVLAVPFFFAASALGLALRACSADISRIYRADLLGAAAGSLGVLGLLAVLPPGHGLRVVGAAGFLAAAA